jgi:lipoyl(octanoyl) transferase
MNTQVPPTPPIRVIVEPEPASGAWNMAVDEVLLESALRGGICTLRWYRWREPTLSLGYFQSTDDPLIDDRFTGLPVVRRLSGGGAILHDRELTYSCALGPGHPLATEPGALYTAMHAAIITDLARVGVNVAPRGIADKGLDANFLCFSRGDANDLVIAGHKVLGSAQRRRRGAVLQHGSLLLERSPVAPEYPGITELSGVPASAIDVMRLAAATADVLGPDVQAAVLTNSEVDRVSQIARQAIPTAPPNTDFPSSSQFGRAATKG